MEFIIIAIVIAIIAGVILVCNSEVSSVQAALYMDMDTQSYSVQPYSGTDAEDDSSMTMLAQYNSSTDFIVYL